MADATKTLRAIPTGAYVAVAVVGAVVWLLSRYGKATAKAIGDAVNVDPVTRPSEIAEGQSVTAPPPAWAAIGVVSGTIHSASLVSNPLFGNAEYRVEWALFNDTGKPFDGSMVAQVLSDDFRADSPNLRFTLAPGEARDFSTTLPGPYSGSFAKPVFKVWLDGRLVASR